MLRSSTNSPFVDNKTPTPDQANAAYLNQVGDEVNANTANIAANTTAIGLKYTKPGPGIPSTDMAAAVTVSLGRADSAAQVAGDLGGTPAAPVVSKVNGVTVTGTPAVGQVMTATSPTAASWQAPTGGGGGNITVVNNGNGTLTLSGSGVVNNGNGTLSLG